MSDLDKVFAYANQFCRDRPIQLRWEGAGDAAHPAALIGALKNMTYTGIATKVKFYAAVNLYEGAETQIAATAKANLFAALPTYGTNEQDYDFWCDIDVTRAGRTADGPAIAGQPKADIMFVRNIMLTDGAGNSLTDAKQGLATLHNTAIRRRANSISDGGSLKLGMSGQPGLKASGAQRDASNMGKLFFQKQDLFDSATESGLTTPLAGRKGGQDADNSVEVMKNNGTSLGFKTTYYLTFIQPNH